MRIPAAGSRQVLLINTGKVQQEGLVRAQKPLLLPLTRKTGKLPPQISVDLA